MAQSKNQKNLNEDKELNKDHNDPTPSISNNLNAPKHGTVIPNRVFVGGIAPATTELDLVHLFSSYGNVTGTKIISDRAGVSKGYGFVTFETEDEAKRLQKDAENIILGQRRLNIAPAIKKQSFGRSSYDCSAGSPIPPTQVYRHNGITFTFHNGMAFFPQPSTPVPPSSHVEPSPVFQSGASYGAVTPSSPGPAYPFPYAPQGQLFYQAPQYQYHVPQYDGCYEASQVMVADGSLVIPQYYITPQPTPELAFYQPAAVHPQEAAPQTVPPLLYASPRTYESALVYSTEPKCGLENGMISSHNGGGMAVISKEEGEQPIQNHHRRPRESAPVVSLLKMYKGKEDQPRRKQHHQQDEGRKLVNLNNNSYDAPNRNLKHHDTRRGTPPTVPPFPPNPNSRHPPVQVPQFPYFPRQVLAPPTALTSFYPPPSQPTRPRSCYRPRYGGGRGGGRGGGNAKWLPKEEELGQPLTPPITPRSEPAAVTGTTSGPEDVVQSIQALAI
ncbi:uncharacterized protein [Halyomorpha halys]|uniref:uncharacterized protein isoform X2 n=1 Tax=Halyomorpha halys TaxID=286706 RepID=UPI0006D51960|nr:uncharacterized protein LOC106681241 isoform X2 [Halyomorpha halys]